MAAERRRLPEVKTLYEILPKGIEGGREFARIVDLLLFHEARKSDKKFTIFSDVAGDYYGLDSFSSFGKHRKIGYQYKFYPSPLSSDHRREIEKSLKKVAENQKNLRIEKWVLITPEDFMETSRKEGGDITWFEGLPEKFNLEFEVEHWGHKNLISLFLETRSLCLYYYPEIVAEGTARKKTLQDIRKRYNDNLNTLYGKIEFVGMSVYKEEATRGVPMEYIYIPLTVIPERTDETDPHIAKTTPLLLLEPGACHVVLGNPGSGKTTLLKFLALVGISKSLQKRYNAHPDERLSILIELRRYADELKTRKNLSLIDYILEVIQGDFSLKSAGLEFLEYYLETGQTILLFDGLDELPNPQYKRIIRDRIRTLITTYPRNTAVVTSRIVGYGSPFCFDEKEFIHYKLTRLQLSDIEQFIRDWYKVRTMNELEREESIKGLIRILHDRDHVAILELAENPLLLTIIVLVHKIDAVLPEERIVLYQKCTETLLNTWYTWKFGAEEIEKKKLVEKWNRRRIEEIAYWMHCQSLGTEESQRAVVNCEDLKGFLTNYIAENEEVHNQDSDPGVQAERFLDFVRERTGLLIEVGDRWYSFIHLMFQEYLASSCILTRGEREGVLNAWKTIKGHCNDARWHEVIRLLIAGHKLYDSQEFLMEKILERTEKSLDITYTLLLSGLLMDGIEAAEKYQKRILYYLLLSASKASDIGELRLVLEKLRIWIGKRDRNGEDACEVFRCLWKNLKKSREKMALLLIATILNWPEARIKELTGNFSYSKDKNAELYRFFLCKVSNLTPSPSLKKKVKLFWEVEDCLLHGSLFLKLVAAVCQAVTTPLGSKITARKAFEDQLISLIYPLLIYPLFHSRFYSWTSNSLQVFLNNSSPIYEWAQNQAYYMALQSEKGFSYEFFSRADRIRTFEHVLGQIQGLARRWAWDQDEARSPHQRKSSYYYGVKARAKDEIWSRACYWAFDWSLGWGLDVSEVWILALALTLALALARDRGWPLIWTLIHPHQIQVLEEALYQKRINKDDLWQSVLKTPDFYGFILDIICSTFSLEPRPHWWEALRVRFLPTIPNHGMLFDETIWKKVEANFENREAGETEIYIASWLLIFDAWLYIHEYYQSQDESMFEHLADVTREIDAPPLRIAHCIRDLAYGDKFCAQDLASMVKSDDPGYRAIFEAVYWRAKFKWKYQPIIEIFGKKYRI